MEKVIYLTESDLADLIRRTALAVANDLRQDLRRAQTKEVMSKAELSEYWGCSIATINRYMKDGMPFEKVYDNAHPTFRRFDVDSWKRIKTRECVQEILR